MRNNESYLLHNALCYEEGHPRRTQHILKVYALAKLLGEQEKLSVEEQQILQAAAILHDIAIKHCKEHCNGDASQSNQKQAAPLLVTRFLEEADYLPSHISKVIDLVIHHHDYNSPRSKLLQLLMEADLIVNCYENRPDRKKAEFIKGLFQTEGGKELLTLCLKEETKLESSMDFSKTIDALTQAMIRFNQNDPLRIHHLIKVHRFAQMIGRAEQLDQHTQFITECAALIHDIGIRPAEQKYGMCNGKLQEKEGPLYARKTLEELGLDEADIERICYLVGHHHTYTDIDGIDYQILVEADFLVNFHEDKLSQESIDLALQKIFQTDTGKSLCKLCYFNN